MRGPMIRDKIILLVEDNPDDELLTLRALKKNGVLNEVVVARDGVEALDYLFGTGSHAGRDTGVMPQLILLDLKLPRTSGFQLLEHFFWHSNWLSLAHPPNTPANSQGTAIPIAYNPRPAVLRETSTARDAPARPTETLL